MSIVRPRIRCKITLRVPTTRTYNTVRSPTTDFELQTKPKHRVAKIVTDLAHQLTIPNFNETSYSNNRQYAQLPPLLPAPTLHISHLLITKHTSNLYPLLALVAATASAQSATTAAATVLIPDCCVTETTTTVTVLEQKDLSAYFRRLGGCE
ncbi:uncharacterized protein K460DRAFT_404565 [Cucurbitaria berberidis CBS 394.84]|uniref:Uncharacterized protein n=1 Tax=Cucurbitaria berberidis CBS 394.84 TaxID=1168544 RepID=A0A9P4LCN1_9PLEO|nr:uncharacterized protein K460DRAFT_404565 [Cucurbitaria berberidis CBS 394.84]KAF1849334.1 hypothetical protein K460DRAFT_404565 [Cucurbitaria berberidis CBS 394.84]